MFDTCHSCGPNSDRCNCYDNLDLVERMQQQVKVHDISTCILHIVNRLTNYTLQKRAKFQVIVTVAVQYKF